MLRIALFCIFLPFALAEMFYNHSFGMIIIGTLYMGLSLQAEISARRLAEEGLLVRDANGNPIRKRRWNEPEEDEWIEELKVSPLGEKPNQQERPRESAWVPPRGAFQQTDPFPGAPVAPPPEIPRTRQAEERRRASRPAGRKPLPPSPNFHGRDHELLGIGENARTRTIVNAFRHWIKRLHPDLNPNLPVAVANDRAMRITEAKERLLMRRKNRRAA